MRMWSLNIGVCYTMPSKKTYKRKRNLSRSKRRRGLSRKHAKKYRGGSAVTFPATFATSSLQNPQSYLPYNDFSSDPNYSVVDSRLTLPFLTSGGRKLKKRKGGGTLAQYASNTLNSSVGQFPTTGLPTDVGGVSAIISNMTGLTSHYNGNPAIPVPIA